MIPRHPGRKTIARLLIGFLGILAAGSVLEVEGQTMNVEIETPFHAARLSGQVTFAGSGLPDVVIDRCEQGWKNCFAQARTDENGNFEFPGVHTKTNYLKCSKPGFNPLLVTIIIDPKAKKKLMLQLPIAT